MTHHAHDAWLVDLDGTLYRARGLKLIMAVELLANPASIRVVRAFRSAHEKLRREGFESDTVSPFDEQIARTARATGLPADRVRSDVMSWMVSKPCRWIRRFRREELVDALTKFRRDGGKTAVVSDYPASDKLHALEVQQLFDVVVSNGEPNGPHALKPSPVGFVMAARMLDIDPTRCLVIGDRDDADGEAARRAGMEFRRVR